MSIGQTVVIHVIPTKTSNIGDKNDFICNEPVLQGLEKVSTYENSTLLKVLSCVPIIGIIFT